MKPPYLVLLAWATAAPTDWWITAGLTATALLPLFYAAWVVLQTATADRTTSRPAPSWCRPLEPELRTLPA